MDSIPTYQTITVQHATIPSKRSFAATRAALESILPPLNTAGQTALEAGDVAAAAAALRALSPLSIFLVRDHGALLAVHGLPPRGALQYEIGNPLTASTMTRHALGAALYAPLRVALLEHEDGSAVFEYDRPVSLFGQLGNAAVDGVAASLDAELRKALLEAGGWDV